MKKTTYINRLRAFEQEKQKLYEQNLSGKELEQGIKKLAEKHKI